MWVCGPTHNFCYRFAQTGQNRLNITSALLGILGKVIHQCGTWDGFYLIEPSGPDDVIFWNGQQVMWESISIDASHLNSTERLVWEGDPVYDIESCYKFTIFIKGYLVPGTVVKWNSSQKMVKLDSKNGNMNKWKDIKSWYEHLLLILCNALLLIILK